VFILTGATGTAADHFAVEPEHTRRPGLRYSLTAVTAALSLHPRTKEPLRAIVDRWLDRLSRR
jgi:hypothetical protein